MLAYNALGVRTASASMCVCVCVCVCVCTEPWKIKWVEYIRGKTKTKQHRFIFVLTAVKGHAGIPNPGLCAEGSRALRSDGIRPNEEHVEEHG